MKVLLYGKNAKNLEQAVTSSGLKLTEDNPDAVISYGGDGTLLSAERHYPSIPKLPLRDDSVCKKCGKHTNEAMLAALKSGDLTKEMYAKLEAAFKDEKLVALNDIVVRNKLPMHAIRLAITVNDQIISSEKTLRPLAYGMKAESREKDDTAGFSPWRVISPNPIIGDGIVAATPFGSTGYFHSITRKTFTEGFAIAFNNPTEVNDPIFLSADDTVRIEVIRGPATLSTDNSSTIYTMNENDTLQIKHSAHAAYIFAYETLRCQDCAVYKDKRLT